MNALILLALTAQSLTATVPLFQRALFDVGVYAALGDSFSAGPSAGDAYDDNDTCRRYTQAYGPQLSNDNAIQGPKPMKFEFIACSGAQTTDIYGGGGGQAAQLAGLNPDLVTITISGNDVNFVGLLDRVSARNSDNLP
jgi:lysophospholipase L1-like esterase